MSCIYGKKIKLLLKKVKTLEESGGQGGGQNYVTVQATSQTTAATDVLPATGSVDTIYRIGNWDGTQYTVTSYSEYAWDGTQYQFLCKKSQLDEVFDITVYNSNTKYANLTAALGTNGANVPQELRRGGMSVKFVQSSDNKYVQYRLMSDTWSVDTEDWTIADEGVYVENHEFIYVKTDGEGKILWAIKTDGSIYWGAGVPQQVIDYVAEKISELSLDEYDDIVAFLSDYLGSDTTLKVLIDSKLDAEGLDPEALATTQVVENPEWLQVTTDSEGRVLEGIRTNGSKYIAKLLPSSTLFDDKIGIFDFDNASLDKLSATILHEKDANTYPCIQFSKTTGDKLYIHLRVKLPADMHNGNGSQEKLLQINSSYLYLNKQKTTFNSYLPVPNYSAYIGANNNDSKSSLISDGYLVNAYLGDDAMALRFSGDCSLTENQDIRLSVKDGVLKLYHNTNPITLIKSYTLSDYTEIRDLYLAIKEDIDNNILEDFEIEWFSISGHSPSEIIECEVSLVSQYMVYQDGDSETNPTKQIYDSFPYYFTLREDGEIHDIEIAIDKNNSHYPAQWIYDGYGRVFSSINDVNDICNNIATITIGDTSGSNVEIIDFEISDNLDFKYPNFRFFYSETTSEGLITNPRSTYYVSEERCAEIFSVLKQNNFGNADADTLIRYLNGTAELKGNVFHFGHDDTDGNRIRLFEGSIGNTYNRGCVIPSFGMIVRNTTDHYVERDFEIMKELFNCGYRYCIHQPINSQYFPPSSNSGSIGAIPYTDLVGVVEWTKNKFREMFGINPIVWGFHQSSHGYNQCRYLKNHGFQFIIGKDGNSMVSKVTRYCCGHFKWPDSVVDITPTMELKTDNYID